MDENGEKLVPQAHAKLAKQNNNRQYVYQKLWSHSNQKIQIIYV